MDGTIEINSKNSLEIFIREFCNTFEFMNNSNELQLLSEEGNANYHFVSDMNYFLFTISILIDDQIYGMIPVMHLEIVSIGCIKGTSIISTNLLNTKSARAQSNWASKGRCCSLEYCVYLQPSPHLQNQTGFWLRLTEICIVLAKTWRFLVLS